MDKSQSWGLEHKAMLDKLHMMYGKARMEELGSTSQSVEIWKERTIISAEHSAYTGYNIMRYKLGPVFESNLEDAHAYYWYIGKGLVHIHDKYGKAFHIYNIRKKKLIDTLRNVVDARNSVYCNGAMFIQVDYTDLSDLGVLNDKINSRDIPEDVYTIIYRMNYSLNELEKQVSENCKILGEHTYISDNLATVRISI